MYVMRLLHQCDGRIFPLFFLWPVFLFLSNHFLPTYRMNPWLFDGLYYLSLFAMLVDFVYYFAMKSPKTVFQMGSLVLILPCLAFAYRGSMLGGESVTLPHYGRALVWTEGLMEPHTYYFLSPDTVETAQRDFDDPNYGQAVFSPFSGEVEGFEADMMILKRGELRIALGPILEGSARVDADDRVVKNQPIGLQGKGDGHPGIRLEVRSGHALRFEDVLAGRLIAGEQKSALLKRNMLVQSNSPTRFRVEIE